MSRAQSNLLAVAMALVILTAATGLGLALADAAFAGGGRPAEERRVAVALSERLVGPSSSLAVRQNVLAADAFDGVDAAALAAEFPVVQDRSFRVRIDDRTVARRGDPTGGSTVRRVVLLERRRPVTRSPDVRPGTVTLPRRTPKVELTLDAPPATTVEAVRVDGRIVLRDERGLDGTFVVETSRLETVRLAFEAEGPLPPGSVSLTYYPATTTKATLEVTVGA